ncbi:MAG: hypothetical protein Q8R55_01795 [Candidatus Taylorbacteria bacterium]|nr:hypothetical protein [Candidatus Taylorbacteria bacterium]
MYAIRVPDEANYQAWSGTITSLVDGHGSGARYGVEACFTTATAAMWTGSCWLIVDRNTGGVVNDVDGNLLNQSRDIGSDPAPNYDWWIVALHASDVTFHFPLTLTVRGRRVSIDPFGLSDSTRTVGQPFNVTWITDQALGGVTLWYTGTPGSVACPVASGAAVGASGLITCTAGPATGTAQFWLEATGPGGSGVTTVRSADAFITITSACGNGAINGVEQCDGANLNGQSCGSLGYATQIGGGLYCNANCTRNTSNCGRYACTANYTCGFVSQGGANLCSSANQAQNCAPSPTAFVYANGARPTYGTTYGTSVTVSWTSTDSSSCSVLKDGSAWMTGTSGSQPQTIIANTTYTINCIGVRPATTATDTLSITIPGPTADIRANGAGGTVSVNYGSNVDITWTSTGAGSCTTSPNIGSGTSGSAVVVPTADITYTLTCTGAGTGTGTVTLDIPPAPTANLTCNL